MVKRVVSYLSMLVLTLMLLATTACVDEKYSSSPNDMLSFSVDTLSFDTLFATIPSRTAIFKIYNNNKEALNISSIRLAGGSESFFRFNVDGRIPPESNILTDVLIRSNDSLYVFVELTAGATEATMPVMVLDSMEFITNGNTQNVKLMAYSRDAIIFNSHSFSCDTTLTAGRPFLIFNYIHIPEDITLTIEEGVSLYFHAGANFIVDGNLVCSGTLENPILMRGDRFDVVNDVAQTPYDYLPSQWGSVYLQNPQGVHSLKYTTIRGGSLGVLLVGANRSKPSLTLSSCKIQTMGQYGLYIQNADVVIENSEISNCGESCVVMLGGTCQTTHTTIANYHPWSSRSTPALVLANYVVNQGYTTSFPIESAIFENSIVYGSLFEELLLDSDTTQSGMFNVLFSYCLLKSRMSTSPYFHEVIWSNVSNGWGNDTVFMNTNMNSDKGYFNFQLDPKSFARDRAYIPVAQKYPLDLLGNSRLSDGLPDMGAYEK